MRPDGTESAAEKSKRLLQERADKEARECAAFVHSPGWEWMRRKLAAGRRAYLGRIATEERVECKLASAYVAAFLDMLWDAPERVLARLHDAPLTAAEFGIPAPEPPPRSSDEPGMWG